MTPFAGVIADDFTGATDIAGLFVRAGLRVRLWFEIPAADDETDGEVVVIALKSRSLPAGVAVERSLAALAALRRLGASRIYFKYCSTFDSTPRGNIGPVAEALMAALSADRVLFCPAFPENGRTVYRGHLFVGDRLLSESGMERHPLNPMTDADLVRVLQSQAARRVGSLALESIVRGGEAVQAELRRLVAAETPLVVADALCDEHLATLAAVVADDPLVTGGSALGFRLAREWQRRGDVQGAEVADSPGDSHTPAAIVAGSCSAATRRQIEHFAARHPDRVHDLDVRRAVAGEPVVDEILNWARERLGARPLLIHSGGGESIGRGVGRERSCETRSGDLVGAKGSGTISSVLRVEGGGVEGDEMEPDPGRSRPRRTAERTAARVEETLSDVAAGLVKLGVRRMIVAGGETSGAVVRALQLRDVRVGREIAAGVPWIVALDGRLSLALKSGNFGGDDFFTRALEGHS